MSDAEPIQLFEKDRRNTPRPDSMERRTQLRPTKKLYVWGTIAALCLIGIIFLIYKFV